MNKFITYKYAEQNVTLAFEFKDDADLEKNQEIFIGLLEKAAHDLREELRKL